MTTLKPGDRVDVHIPNLEVRGAYKDGVSVHFGHNQATVPYEYVTKITPPLPTKIGAVVRTASGWIWTRYADNCWKSTTHAAQGRTDTDMASFVFDVLSEGVDIP